MSQDKPKESKFEKVMTRIDAFMKKFEKNTFAEVKTTEDSTLIYDGELEVGTAIFIMIEEEQVPLTKGSYDLTGDHEGTTIVVDDEGIVTEITNAPEGGEEGSEGGEGSSDTTEQVMSKEEREKKAGKEIFESTIRVVSKWDLNVSADSIEVGTELVEVWDGEEWGKIASGEYELENGDLIQVNGDGVVVMVTPKNGGSSSEGEGVTQEEMSQQLKAQEEKLNKKFEADNAEMISLMTDMADMMKTFGEQGSEPTTKKKFNSTEANDGLSDKQRAIMLSLQKKNKKA